MSATETPPDAAPGPEPVSIKPRSAFAARLTAPTTQKLILPIVFLGLMALLPLLLDQSSPLLRDATLAAAYVVMALGLNIIVGFAGLLDLGYVAFFAIGAYTIGWLGSGFYADANGGEGIHIGVTGFAASLPGIHVNFLLILVAALIFTTIAGMVIGLPTLRLRGDYIAIVTLAFGEIIGDIAENGDRLSIGGYQLTNGKQGITPVDKIQLPFTEPFTLGALDGRPWFWVALALVALVLPLCVLAVPFLDTGFVIAKRIKYRRPVYRADSNHFHHRLHRIGFSQRRTVAYLYVWTALMAGLALALRFVPYSDDRGNLDAGWSAVMAALFLAALTASAYLVYVLEILKLKRLRAWQIRRAEPGTEEHVIDAAVAEDLETGEFSTVR